MADFLKLVSDRTTDEQTAALLQGIVRVGGGRGFVVEHGRKRDRRRLVITAAHCLPGLPPPHPFSGTEERTYGALLGPLGDEPTVCAECLFVDPIADVAVLGSPDNQTLPEEADAYDHLVSYATEDLAIGDAPKRRGSAYLFSKYGEWRRCSVTRRGVWLSVEDKGLVASGMSGSPIMISADGEAKAIGLVSTGPLNPVLRDNLPSWFFPKLDRRGRKRSVSP